MKFAKIKYLLLRRICQVSILVLFILGNYSIATLKNVQYKQEVGIFGGNIESLMGNSSSVLAKEPSIFSHIVQGNLSHSSWFGGIFSLTDPLSVMQIFLAGGGLALDVLLGALLVAAIYGIFLGRVYCAFVCPINLVTDFANFLRDKLGFNTAQRKLFISRSTRFVILGLGLLLSALFGVAAFELISPISMLHRGVVFGMGFGIFAVLAVFCFDLFVLKNGFCGHICPLGAMYSLLGKFALLRVKHTLSNCTKCMECVRVCPEPEVLKPIGKQDGNLKTMTCLRCGRCIEACDDNALHFSILHFTQKEKK
ncbi:NapH/MauN family ferredoxin-type protein [Helicobacter cinaedi PAGU611]|uniref:Ferredoxin-type protein NapH n=1 Tax=Helicobacter cinaedi CCUG 18818 = ATCC BAA-847 TaxID=537971 RepID=A0ABN0BBW0_9HELI|nr:quinol dehydrogenase ferredoxin subunit NapH [Helicobacter cinaedi]EFR47050.1 putative ferredoxin-type protein NapH [Helicobacter cinaedi CCUG 18818 = ATCC BAA-847]QOQ91468.1 quinol dehydrogenase ferredoxin subunit NapH [Helicobacter cinaedi]QOQ95660.1 quinol dehydrogenase ferredoxin subunit NapH [Helicobacter cinaedi]BAM11984.1 NapH/MauN family ferredoxin-type protein [Helicobacter cinaedi PAGU611]BBB19589.1 polyferredoxin NapH [Helicobacter cinaedi]